MKRAFTVAELLIVIAIMGIIASSTISAVINNNQITQYKTALKENLAILSQATNLLLKDYGGNLSGVFSNENDFRNEYIKYLSYVKSCDLNQVDDVCWHSDNQASFLNNTPINGWGWGDTYSGVILSNGAMMIFPYPHINCDDNYFTPITTACGGIVLDVNGFKGPNVVGKDIYELLVLKDRIIPMGGMGITASGFQESSCKPADTGYGCASVYLRQ